MEPIQYLFYALLTTLVIVLLCLWVNNSEQGRFPLRGTLGVVIGFFVILAFFYYFLEEVPNNSFISSSPETIVSTDSSVPNEPIVQTAFSWTTFWEKIYIAITAFLPAVAYMFYIISVDDKKPEPLPVLLLTAFLGSIAAFVAILSGWELFHEEFFTGISHKLSDSIHIGFLKIAIPSELLKWFFLIVFLRLNKYYDEYVDGVVYSVCLAMGFACIICVWYLYDYAGLSWFILKGLLTTLILIPIHLMAGAVMGYFVALARKGMPLLNYILALVTAVVVDGIICTMLAMMGSHWGYYSITGIVLLVLSLIVYRQVRHLLALDKTSLGN